MYVAESGSPAAAWPGSMLAELERTAAAAGADRVVLNTGYRQPEAIALLRGQRLRPHRRSLRPLRSDRRRVLLRQVTASTRDPRYAGAPGTSRSARASGTETSRAPVARCGARGRRQVEPTVITYTPSPARSLLAGAVVDRERDRGAARRPAGPVRPSRRAPACGGRSAATGRAGGPRPSTAASPCRSVTFGVRRRSQACPRAARAAAEVRVGVVARLRPGLRACGSAASTYQKPCETEVDVVAAAAACCSTHIPGLEARRRCRCCA